MTVHKNIRVEHMMLAGVKYAYVELFWHTDAPGYDCEAERMPSVFEKVYHSPLDKDELKAFGKACCGSNCKRTDETYTLEIALDRAPEGYVSRVVCKDWAKTHVPDLYYQLFPEEKIEWVKLDLRKPLVRTGPVNAYGLTQGETADENLRLLSEQIGKQFVREMALARRVTIDEILRTPSPGVESEPVTLGRGDSTPWWIRKGCSEPPMSHEM